MPVMLRAGHGLILLVIALLGFGVVMVTSAGLSVEQGTTINPVDVLQGRSAILALLAVAALLIGMWVPVQWLHRAGGPLSPIPWMVLVMIGLLIAVHIPGIGKEVNGARRWIEIGPISFQPSELAKWGLLIVIAWHCARRVGSMNRFFTGFAPPMILVGVICALIATEDLGTAVLIGAVSVALLVAGGARVGHALLLLPIGVVGFMAAVIASPYRAARLQAFLGPFDDPQGIGYHVIQSMAAVAGGGLPGRGLGASVQKFGYLPEDTTDFLFAIICEELGIVGACVVVGLYVCLLLCGLSIIKRVDHPFGRLLGLGVVLTIGLQAFINMAVVTGIAPTKGIALPLLSSGGTGWIVTAFFVGLLVSMDRQQAKQQREIEAVTFQCKPTTACT
ncbi:MAG: cell division protein FtsW [Phycisphaerales bacterium]|nr:MAG: cell division protein FtsW [Phycisphaerales bacterium]